MDEAMMTLNKNALTYYVGPMARGITSNSNPQRTTMFKRVKDILNNGFYLCGRKYSFLAFSSNQLRDRSAWFFAEDKNTGVANIKNWMGKFTNRILQSKWLRLLSDGIGMMSVSLAVEVAEKLQISTDPPCAYQIRYAGYKGVIVRWPNIKDGTHLHLVTRSMRKFESNHTILEICSWTRFQPGFLNRQIVTLLSALEVEDGIFWRMQETMVSRLDRMLEDTDMAFDVVTGSCTDQGSTAAIMLSAGFKPQTEPHLRVSIPSLEESFVKHGSRFSENEKKLQVVKGLVAIAKNPCLHPGDVRILEAKGERPHTNEASGSDLDGDLYFVTWDENLIPPSKRSWIPMDYTAGEARELPRGREALGTICNAHVVHADLSEYGALDEKCIKLAELAAIAVDFPKTGKIVTMPPELKPKLYPDFMGKEELQTYHSTKILGKLYRKIKDAYDRGYEESSEQTFALENITYDRDLEITGSKSFIADAWNCKCSYDGQLIGL
ncbi:hypothetical protein DH2020_001875 [Rehmannia glutinosa]|uniref:RNA-dependent RNA polymerase n=1 Tax=Rehmannia glutinosa TaxID=99300 RepID=A0ABR0XS69_REHGL